METKLITLDNLYGFAIYLTEPGLKANPGIRNRSRIVADKNNNPMMFSNVNLAVLMAEVNIGLIKGEFKLKVIKFDHKKNKITDICNYEAMHKINDNTYQVIVKDMMYCIREQSINTVKSIRYFVFEDGDKIRTETPYGRKRNKQLMKIISNGAVEYLYKVGTLSHVKRLSPDELEIGFKNSTAKIRVLTNGLIANINRNRKEDVESSSQYQRCIPFDNSLDKYVTLYSYVTKELAEPDGFGFGGEIDNDIEACYEYIEKYIRRLAAEKDEKLDTLKFLPVLFNGTILSR
jgi:hypothetical protein